MKTSLIAATVAVALVTVASSFAHAGKAHRAAASATIAVSSSKVLLPGTSSLVTLQSEGVEYLLPETVIVGNAPAKASSKVWTCGAIEANLVGGSQRTCEYR